MSEMFKTDLKNYFEKIFKTCKFAVIEELIHEKSFEELSQFMSKKFANRDLYKVLGIDDEIANRKNDKASDFYRNLGNDHFRNKKFSEALWEYYKALAYAQSDHCKAKCFGNISAAFLQLKKFTACLNTIEFIKEIHQIKDDFLDKILKREERCRESMIEMREKSTNKLLLSYPKNPLNSEIINCIERRASGGIFTKQDLKITDIIAITRPFIDGPNRKVSWSCENCRAFTFDTGVLVCDICSNVLYCSKKCKTEDVEFHKYICRNIYSIVTSAMTHQEYMAWKFTLKLLSNGIDIRNPEIKNSKTTCFDWSEDSLSNKVKSILNQKTAYIKSSRKFEVLVMFFVILDQMKQYTPLKDLLGKFQNGEELLFKTFWTAFQAYYSFGITTDIHKTTILESFYLDLLTGLFNHSCVPNIIVCRSRRTGDTHFVVISKIKAGEELFIAYR